MADQPIGQAALEAFEAQGVLQPGTEGFWQVWGATPASLRAGDILLCKVRDTEEIATDYIAETFKAKSAARIGFVDQDGERLTIGALAPCIIVRWGTHGTLCERAR